MTASEDSRWFFTHGDNQQGPFTWQQLLGLAARGELSPHDMLLQQGREHWIRASALRALFVQPISAHAPTEQTAPKLTILEAPSGHSHGSEPSDEPPLPGVVPGPQWLTSSLSAQAAEPAPQTIAPNPRATEPIAPSLPLPNSVEPTWCFWPHAKRFGVGVLVGGVFYFLSFNLAQPRVDRVLPSKSGEFSSQRQGISALDSFKKSDEFVRFKARVPLLSKSDGTSEEQEAKSGSSLRKSGPASADKNDASMPGGVPPKNSSPKPPPTKYLDVEAYSSSVRIAAFVQRLNCQRKDAGVGHVRLDANLSRYCVAHAKYLAQNAEPREATWFGMNQEDPNKPGFSMEGWKTARTALVAYAEPLVALDLWMGHIYGRGQLLSPQTQSVGIGFHQTARGDLVCVLDLFHGRTDGAVAYPVESQRVGPVITRDLSRPLTSCAAPCVLNRRPDETCAVLYPYPDQANVPCVGSGELDEAKEEAIGFPISVSFPPNTTLRNVRAVMTDAQGKIVNIRISSPEHPLNGKFQRLSIGLHPVGLLQAGQCYSVNVVVTANEREWQHCWQFTTSQ